jgi:hypothetical protein
VDTVDSYMRRTCPQYPQPYDDGVSLLRGPSARPEDHNKHSLRWYIFWGSFKPVVKLEKRKVLIRLNQQVSGQEQALWSRLTQALHHRRISGT